MVGSYALTILQCASLLPWVRRCDCLVICRWASLAASRSRSKRWRCGSRREVVWCRRTLRLLGPGLNGSAEGQQLPFGLAYQRDEDFALAPALPPKTPHDLVQGSGAIPALVGSMWA